MTDVSDLLGIAILFVAIVIGALALYLVRGKARLAPILHAFVQVTLVPERRRRFLLLLWIETVCFLAAGVLLGLYNLGIQLTSDPDLLFTAAFLGGMAALGALTWVGLSPRALSEDERTSAERMAPTVLQSLWTVPYQRLQEMPPKERPPE